MKKLAIFIITGAGATLGLALVSYIAGPLCELYDGCECGRERVYYSFEQCRGLRHIKFVMRVQAPGVAGHEHKYWDAQGGRSFSLW